MIKTTIKNKQRGDTIIEVMVAVVILGMAFAISYATASHALQMSQNSQEHSRALQILDSQVELVRLDSGDAQLYSGVDFCMKTDASVETVLTSVACNPVNGGANYHVQINYNPATVAHVTQDIFTFKITWLGIGDLGQQEEQISYKLHQ